MKQTRYLSLGEALVQENHSPALDPRTHADKIAIALLALLSAVICNFTWHKWGSLTIDCGREMWVPAAIEQGKRLYFDIWYPYGPLIPYWHALLFRVFGIHLSVLYTAGLGIVGLLLAVVYSLGRVFLSVPLSFTVSFAFLAMALQPSLFNYVLPYSYPAAYGALLFATLLWLLVRECFREKRFRMVASGIIAAIALLTKIEVGIAAYGLLGFAIAVRAWRKESLKVLFRDVLICFPPFVAAAAVYGLLIYKSSLQFVFADNLPVLPQSYFVQHFGHDWAETLGFSTSPRRLLFSVVANLVGTAITISLLRLCAVSRLAKLGCGALALGLCALQVRLMFDERLLGWLVLLNQAAAYLFFSPQLFWSSLVLLFLSGWSLWRSKQRDDLAAVVLLAAASLAFGVRTMTKMAPFGYPVFYGVFPYFSSIVLVYYSCAMLRIQIPVPLWRWFAVIFCGGIMALTLPKYTPARTWRVTTERGSFVTDATTGAAFSEVLSFLRRAKADSKTFVVWPQECAFYFFSGTNAPNRWHTLTPGVLPPGPQTAAYLADLDRQRIQYVVLSSRIMKEYSTPVFGDDYNQEVYAWLQRNFRPLQTMGNYQRASTVWGAIVYERKPGATE